MKILMILVFCVTSMTCFGQGPVSGGGDKDLASLINKVEGNSKTDPAKGFSTEFKAEADYQKAAHDVVEKYFKAQLTGDVATCYTFMSSDYRNAVPETAYVKKRFNAPRLVQVKDMKFADEKCVRVVGSVIGTPDARMGEMTLPIRLRLFLEDGKWVIYSNPYQQMGFTLPGAEKVKFPCEL